MTGASLRDRASQASPRALLRGLGHPVTIASAYAVVALFTFGHSAAHIYSTEKAEYASCKAAEAKDDHRVCVDFSAGDAVFNGLGAGLLWPFYWSWELQQ